MNNFGRDTHVVALQELKSVPISMENRGCRYPIGRAKSLQLSMLTTNNSSLAAQPSRGPPEPRKNDNNNNWRSLWYNRDNCLKPNLVSSKNPHLGSASAHLYSRNDLPFRPRGGLPSYERVTLLPVPPLEVVVNERREDIPSPHRRLKVIVGQELLIHGGHAVGVILGETPSLDKSEHQTTRKRTGRHA